MNAATRRKRAVLRDRRRDARAHSLLCRCRICHGDTYTWPVDHPYNMFLYHRYTHRHEPRTDWIVGTPRPPWRPPAATPWEVFKWVDLS